MMSDRPEDPLVDNLGEIPGNLKRYFSVKMEMLKLRLTEEAAIAAGKTASAFVLIRLGSLVFLSFWIALSLFLGEMLDSYALGFVASGGSLLVLAILLFIFRAPLIQAPVRDRMIRKILERL